MLEAQNKKFKSQLDQFVEADTKLQDCLTRQNSNFQKSYRNITSVERSFSPVYNPSSQKTAAPVDRRDFSPVNLNNQNHNYHNTKMLSSYK